MVKRRCLESSMATTYNFHAGFSTCVLVERLVLVVVVVVLVLPLVLVLIPVLVNVLIGLCSVFGVRCSLGHIHTQMPIE